MTIHFKLLPVISIVAGIAVLMFPRLLPYIVGIYLIVYGVLMLAR